MQTVFAATISIALRSINESLYTAYVDAIRKIVSGFSEDDSRTNDNNVTKAYEVYLMSDMILHD